MVQFRKKQRARGVPCLRLTCHECEKERRLMPKTYQMEKKEPRAQVQNILIIYHFSYLLSVISNDTSHGMRCASGHGAVN